METVQSRRAGSLAPVAVLVGIYVGVVIATLAALAVLSAAGSRGATQEAWVHSLIVAAFAVLLPLRLRAARRGRRGALEAVAVIAAVLAVVNIVEALVPGLFPSWLRVEVVAIAALMIALVVLALRARKRPTGPSGGAASHGAPS